MRQQRERRRLHERHPHLPARRPPSAASSGRTASSAASACSACSASRQPAGVSSTLRRPGAAASCPPRARARRAAPRPRTGCSERSATAATVPRRESSCSRRRRRSSIRMPGKGQARGRKDRPRPPCARLPQGLAVRTHSPSPFISSDGEGGEPAVGGQQPGGGGPAGARYQRPRFLVAGLHDDVAAHALQLGAQRRGDRLRRARLPAGTVITSRAAVIRRRASWLVRRSSPSRRRPRRRRRLRARPRPLRRASSGPCAGGG